jgi:hypothetical protein
MGGEPCRLVYLTGDVRKRPLRERDGAADSAGMMATQGRAFRPRRELVEDLVLRFVALRGF